MMQHLTTFQLLTAMAPRGDKGS